MKKYYILLLNNCYDVENKEILANTCSMIPNVLVKEYTTLSIDEIKKDFISYDDTIIIDRFSWIVKGSFPVIAEEINYKLYDIITGKEIKYSPYTDETKTLSYKDKYQIDETIVKESIELLDKPSIERYAKGLEKIEKYTVSKWYGILEPEKYYIITPNDNGVLIPLLTTKEINGQIIDILTNKKIYPSSERKITSHLNYTIKNKIDREVALSLPVKVFKDKEKSYRKSVKKAKMNSQKRYNNYIINNNNRNFEDRIEPENKSKVPVRIKKINKKLQVKK